MLSSGRCAASPSRGNRRLAERKSSRPVDREPGFDKLRITDSSLHAGDWRRLRRRRAARERILVDHGSGRQASTEPAHPPSGDHGERFRSLGQLGARPGRLRNRVGDPAVRARPADGGPGENFLRHDLRPAPAVARRRTIDGEGRSAALRLGGHLCSLVPSRRSTCRKRAQGAGADGEVADGLILLAGFFPRGAWRSRVSTWPADAAQHVADVR